MAIVASRTAHFRCLYFANSPSRHVPPLRFACNARKSLRHLFFSPSQWRRRSNNTSLKQLDRDIQRINKTTTSSPRLQAIQQEAMVVRRLVSTLIPKPTNRTTGITDSLQPRPPPLLLMEPERAALTPPLHPRLTRTSNTKLLQLMERCLHYRVRYLQEFLLELSTSKRVLKRRT